MVQPEPQGLGKGGRVRVVLTDPHVAAGRAATRAPGQKRLAVPACAAVVVSRADLGQADPAGAVGRVGHRRAGELAECHASVALVVEGHARVTLGRVAHQDLLGVLALQAHRRPQQAIGDGQPRRQLAAAAYQATIAGIASGRAEISSGTAELAVECGPVPGPQQPAVQPGLLDGGARPRRPHARVPGSRRCAPVRRSIPAAPPRRRARTRPPRPSSSAPEPPDRPPTGGLPHRSAAGPTRRGAGSEPSPVFRGPATRPSVAERVGPFARHPRQPGNSPAV